MKEKTWLDTAVSGIRFSPDRAEARAELAAHMEDKTAELRRIFPDIPEEEARERALASMGDAEEVKKELAKVHRPWLGRLWMASRFAFWILFVLWLLAAASRSWWFPWEDELRGHMIGYSRAEYGAPDRPEPAQAKLGGYTFQIVDAACRKDRPYGDDILIIVRVSSPRFWERVDWYAVQDALTVIAPDGTAYPMNRSVRQDPDSIRVSMDLVCRWDIFYRDFAVKFDEEYAKHWTPGDRVTLNFDFPKGSFALSAGVTERVVWE